MQALEKEIANFGKEKDKHIGNAQAKAKKAKADTEVGYPHDPPSFWRLQALLRVASDN